MSEPIKIPVDLTNPGQFFACCGLLELADRLWPGATGWFEPKEFCMEIERCGRDDCPLPKRVHSALTCGPADASRDLLVELLTETKTLNFDVGDDEETNDAEDNQESGRAVRPVELRWSDGRVLSYFDWWSEKNIKPWAGRMDVRVILRAMLDSINPACRDPFNDLKVAYYIPPGKKKGKKREPFYFDPRRGNKSHPLDCGFSPDTQEMEAECCPALEALCFIGLQRARPAPTGVANQSRYTVWPRLTEQGPGIPANLVGAVSCGAVRFAGSTDYVFDNYFRTDQRKYKTFSQATAEGSTNV